ncbi:MAG TPA: hypothetical protein VHO01_08415 [Jatrophihabitans sp.]|nr:hypothetical protein [Jatrophihabitans sp.]
MPTAKQVPGVGSTPMRIPTGCEGKSYVPKKRRTTLVIPALVASPLLAAFLMPTASAAPAAANPHAKPHHPGHAVGYDGTYVPNDGGPARSPEDDGGDLADQAQQFSYERSAPADSVSAQALLAARAQAAAMPRRGGSWTEQTNSTYDSEPAGYTDPVWSNAGAGESLVSGRVTALAADRHELYAGAAGGGVWASKDGGRNWTPLSDNQPTLSTGALAVNPEDHSLWVGTGEANTNADSYLGTGVYRLATNGSGKPHGALTLVGGSALVDHQVYRLLFDDDTVFAATSQGLYRMPADGRGRWQLVLAPTATPSPYVNHITDVAVRPGTHGRSLVAVNGYRGGSPENGIYASNDGGRSWTEVTPTGALDGTDIGRTTLAYAGDGRLYALMESPAYLNSGVDPTGSATNLKGFYVSTSGNPAGPWTLLADSTKLQNSGSAITKTTSPGYNVGVQAWYNQALAVDPANPNTVFVSLEEVFKTTDGGQTFTTASPYWDYGLPCGTSCPKTTHPDQHALLIDNGSVIIGNDGGVYARPESRNGYGGWSDLNTGLHTLQFYDASAGRSGTGLAFWGGMQDNGTGVFAANKPGYEPASGDGFNVIVNPANAQQAVGEYTDLAAYSTTDGGHSFTTISPSCYGQEVGYGGQRPDCDPSARFQAPLAADTTNPNHWVAGGEYVWDTTKGWNTRCNLSTCDWQPVFDLGAANAATAVNSANGVTYAAWVGGSGNPSATFTRGIATNYGGTWHQLDTSSLPNRYIAGVTVDKANGAHAYAIMNGYSRRWIDGAGTGVVFETTDGGASWHDISGNLPDAPGDALIMRNGQLVLGTDVGAFTTDAAHPGHWFRAGGGLPNAPIINLTMAPDGSVVAATHGRGIWTLRP